MNEIENKLMEYINKTTNATDIKVDEDIFEKGIVHSLFAMQLILFIEKEFDVELEDEDLDFEKIKSVKEIAKLVEENM